MRTRLLAVLLGIAAPGCSLHMSAELLNPLNKSGRTEHSEPQPPKAAPSPTPSPEPSATPGHIEYEVSPLDIQPQRIAARRVR